MADAAGEPRPLKLFVRIFSAALVFAGLIMVATLAWYLTGRVGGLGRFVVAALMSAGIAWFGIAYFRQLANPPPPEPAPTDVHPSLQLAYVCEMCGLELAVVKVAKEKAPRHCGESMELVRIEG